MRRVTRPVFREAYGLVRPAVAVLVQLIDHRNAETAQCNPSRDVLGGEAGYSVRSVSEGTAQLASLGFIQKEQELRTGWATTNAYYLTPRFFEALATPQGAPTGCNSSSRPAANSAADRLQFLQTNGGDPLDPPSKFERGIRGERPPPPRRGGATRRRLAALRHPSPPAPNLNQKGGSGQSAPVAPDPDYTAFAQLFAEERSAHYDDGEPGHVGKANQARIAALVSQFVGKAVILAAERGRDVDRDALREELVRSLVRAWFAHEGTKGRLRDSRHPIGLIVGDLPRFGDRALAAWKAAQDAPPQEAADSAPRSAAAETTAPEPQNVSPALDRDFAPFATWFAEERARVWKDDDRAALQLGPENQIKIVNHLADLAAEAGAWAEMQGITVDRARFREELARSMVRTWLGHDGTDGHLREKRHPIGWIVGDLARLGGRALEGWKRAQQRRNTANPLPGFTEIVGEANRRATGLDASGEMQRPATPSNPPTTEAAELEPAKGGSGEPQARHSGFAAGAAQVLAGLNQAPAKSNAPMRVRWVPAAAPPPPEGAESAAPSGADVPSRSPVAPPGEPAAGVSSVSAGSPQGPAVESAGAPFVAAQNEKGKPDACPTVERRHSRSRLALPPLENGAATPLAPPELSRDETPPRPPRYRTRTCVSLPTALGVSLHARGEPSPTPTSNDSTPTRAEPALDPDHLSSNDDGTHEGTKARGRGREPPA